MLGLISDLLDYHPLLSSRGGSDLLLGPGVELFPCQDPSLAEHVQYQRTILKSNYNGYDRVLLLGCDMVWTWRELGIKNPESPSSPGRYQCVALLN